MKRLQLTLSFIPLLKFNSLIWIDMIVSHLNAFFIIFIYPITDYFMGSSVDEPSFTVKDSDAVHTCRINFHIYASDQKSVDEVMPVLFWYYEYLYRIVCIEFIAFSIYQFLYFLQFVWLDENNTFTYQIDIKEYIEKSISNVDLQNRLLRRLKWYATTSQNFMFWILLKTWRPSKNWRLNRLG